MGKNLGELEQLLLMALLRRGGDASGIDLREELLDRTGRTVLPGAIYTIMERLRSRNLVTAFSADRAPERGGRRRKYYSISPEGERELARSFQQVDAMADGLRERLLARGGEG